MCGCKTLSSTRYCESSSNYIQMFELSLPYYLVWQDSPGLLTDLNLLLGTCLMTGQVPTDVRGIFHMGNVLIIGHVCCVMNNRFVGDKYCIYEFSIFEKRLVARIAFLSFQNTFTLHNYVIRTVQCYLILLKTSIAVSLPLFASST